MTTSGRTTSSSPNRTSAAGSESSTLVSRTKVRRMVVVRRLATGPPDGRRTRARTLEGPGPPRAWSGAGAGPLVAIVRGCPVDLRRRPRRPAADRPRGRRRRYVQYRLLLRLAGSPPGSPRPSTKIHGQPLHVRALPGGLRVVDRQGNGTARTGPGTGTRLTLSTTARSLDTPLTRGGCRCDCSEHCSTSSNGIQSPRPAADLPLPGGVPRRPSIRRTSPPRAEGGSAPPEPPPARSLPPREVGL